MVMFSSNFRMSDENEGVETLETTELSPIPIAQVTSPDDGKKSKDKQEKKGVFRCEWLTEFNFLKEYKADKSKATCIAAELKIRFNSFLSCTEVYNIFLSKLLIIYLRKRFFT